MRTRPRLLPIFPAQPSAAYFLCATSAARLVSTVVRPSLRRPSSRSAWAIQLRIVCSLGSNSRAQLTGAAPGSMKLDYLLAKLGWISSSCSWHRVLHSPKGLGVHETGGTPDTPAGRFTHCRYRLAPGTWPLLVQWRGLHKGAILQPPGPGRAFKGLVRRCETVLRERFDRRLVYALTPGHLHLIPLT